MPLALLALGLLAAAGGGGCNAGDEAAAGVAADDGAGAGTMVQDKQPVPDTAQTATFGAGCFWGVEQRFRMVDGVVDAAVGYLGGTKENPTYYEVCTGQTGHAEVVQLKYDPAKVSYEQLLELFWKLHDPTTLNRQGPDTGSQYRSAIFYHTPEQKAAAEASKRALEESGRLKRAVVTEITQASEFYRAEEYHQQYNAKHGRTCTVGGH